MEKNLKAEEIIRSELNIEKWSIWVSPNSNSKPQVRIIERELNIEDKQVKATVEIGYTHKGALTTFDQKVFYALIKLWEESGETDSPTFFSLNELARKLEMGWGTTQIKLLKDSLDRLRITPFLWKHSFYNAEENKRLTVNEDPFFLITKLKTISREEDGRQTKPQGYFQFHPLILNNLKANYRKPVLFSTILSFKSDHAQMLYSHLDLILSGNDNYERTSINLFEDLGITGASYKDKRRRKAKLNLILKELQDKPLSNGRFLKVSVTDTKAKDDIKIVCATIAAQQSRKAGEKPPTREETVLADLRQLKIPAKKAKEFIAEDLDETERQLLNLKRRMAMKNLDPIHSPHKWLEKAIAEQYPPLAEAAESGAAKPVENFPSSITIFDDEQPDRYRQTVTGLIVKLQAVELPNVNLGGIENELLEILTQINSDDARVESIHLQEKLDDLNSRLLEQIWDSLDSETQIELSNLAENAIGGRRARLTKELLKAELERTRLYEMQVRYKLPRLNLFDL